MKKRILLAISAMFILALTVAVFAFNQSNGSSKTAADSCAMKGMNAQAADGETKTSCCDKDDCCCKGDSCPMKDKESKTASVDMKNVTVATGESCCCACCKSKNG